MQRKQKGFGFFGWLFILALFGFSLSVVFKLIPIYYQNLGIKQSFENVVKDPNVVNQMPEQIRDHFRKYLTTNTITVVTPEKLMITENGNKKDIQLDYEVRKSFVGNIDLVVYFHYKETV